MCHSSADGGGWGRVRVQGGSGGAAAPPSNWKYDR